MKQHADRGPRIATVAWLAALALVVLSRPTRAEPREQAKATVAYVRKLQTQQGGFAGDAGKTQPSLRATLAALRALKYCGGEVPDRSAAERFVKSCFEKESGGFADIPGGKPDVATTAVGAMALVELKLPTDPYEADVLRYLGAHVKSFEDIRIAAAGTEALGKRPQEAKNWLKELGRMEQADVMHDARQTGGATVALLRLGVKLTTARTENTLATLNAGQKLDGGFGKDGPGASDLETTYRVTRCYHLLSGALTGERKQRLLAFIDKCRNDDGGYGVAPGQPSSVAATYYAAIIRHWQSEP
jgi:prenyltransferase beta subunit